ncbi:sulfotransferase domain-containing protein [Bradyrhizobium sp. LjRoot220]|uniref:sulfotransferase domain-containing protein n=1 Tax=Bradyrhizobium sp. LjRoot220 TaxID=3342284 RepID=UPI003ECFC30A
MTVVNGSPDFIKQTLKQELRPARRLQLVAKPYSDRWAAFPNAGRRLVMFENTDVANLVSEGFLQSAADDTYVLSSPAPAPKIFVVCTPKSGSSFLVTLLQNITGFGHYNPVFADEQMLEGDPYLPNMEVAAQWPSVSQLHCHAKPKTLALCEQFSIRPIFLTRDIYDSLLSMKEYIDRVPHHELFPNYYELATEDEKRAFIVNVYAPIIVRIVSSWRDAFSEQRVPIYWETYRRFFGDPMSETRAILRHLGLEYTDRQIQDAIERTQNEAGITKLNKGVSGRGRAAFAEHERRQVEALIESFGGFDPSVFEGIPTVSPDNSEPLAANLVEKGRKDRSPRPMADHVTSERPSGSTEVRAQELMQLGGGRGSVYRFDELLTPQESQAPPLIFLHVPKAAGSTLNAIFMKNYKFRADSRGDSFFSRYTPRELVNLANAPRSEDDRTRPGFFTGHINLDNEIFRSMPVRYVAITLLRDPVDRAISHYRFNSTQPSVFQDAIRDGLSVVDYCRKFADAVATQYSIFAPQDGVDAAIRRLEEEISFFGLQSEFSQCVEALGVLLGLPTRTYRNLNATATDAATVTPSEVAELQSLFSEDVKFYTRAVEIYRERMMRLPKPASEHRWARYYS